MTEKIIIFLFLLGSIAYLFWAQELTFGNLGSPKSGFLPTLAGTAALLLSLFLFYSRLQSKKANEQEKVDWTKFLFIIIGLLFYIMILKYIGYFAATFIFLFYLLKVTDTSGWIFPLLISFSSSAIFYLLFAYYLKVTLP
jgi:putative tricarboxylic transport membrane protein